MVVLDHVGDPNSHWPSAWWRRWPSRIGPGFRPASTPELHRMERVWRQVQDQLRCHRWWADWHARWDATEALSGHLKARLHQTKGPGLAIVQNSCATT